MFGMYLRLPECFVGPGVPSGTIARAIRTQLNRLAFAAVYCDWYVFGLPECFVGFVEGAKQGLSPSLFAQLIGWHLQRFIAIGMYLDCRSVL